MPISTVLENNRQNVENPRVLSRRVFLKRAASGLGVLALAPNVLHAEMRRERSLSFYNSNTSETIRRVYWTPRDGYIRESLKEVSWGLRDHHNNEVKAFDVNVLDQLYALQLQLEMRTPVHIISGYRSPTTNGWLGESNRGVARNSYHMQAMALDVRLPSGGISDLYQMARSLGAGGVGYYPHSNFVHIDSGPIRYWG